MPANKISRTRRRKLERDAALRDYHALASELGLKLVNVHGIRPEIFYDAVALLHEVRELLPQNTRLVVYSNSPETGVYIVTTNCEKSA